MRAFHIGRLLSRPRVCIFCGRPPADKTREHVIPQWLIELTGDPNRKIILGPFVSQSLIRGRSDPFKSFSFNSFAFPSCGSCNSRFAALEGRARPLISALLAAEPLGSSAFDTILDWFDKVRVGLWLAFHYFLDRNFWGVQPHFFITDRLAAADRCLIVQRSASYEPGIRFAGVNTPAFAHTPSSFSLIINEWFLTNISFQFLVSEAAGFPYSSSFLFGPDEKLQIHLEQGKGSIRRPLVSFHRPDGALLIGQPIIPQLNSPEDVAHFYDSEYVSRMTAQGNRGRVLIDASGGVSLYPDLATRDWCPQPAGDFLQMVNRNAIDTLQIQNDLVRLASPSPALSADQRQLMETQNANCILANNAFIDLIT